MCTCLNWMSRPSLAGLVPYQPLDTKVLSFDPDTCPTPLRAVEVELSTSASMDDPSATVRALRSASSQTSPLRGTIFPANVWSLCQPSLPARFRRKHETLSQSSDRLNDSRK